MPKLHALFCAADTSLALGGGGLTHAPARNSKT
eukprot:CAMPEP_0173417178 /NCGR_PEP_ID=MMETSP1356-20130122/85769_1 /TAXON_ID=77927 ORGANISM="Hemiselmis virescens, Strain PCC157" /NCGR_SAMPLE_ID=MMETSP1356 /ASSEMBLY_ACC=CAM_ASM_000847 /LENGTH=32 /DNA_ID= /DNA_START= /DNA_END= /DNA_ORIENTATION=